MFTARSHVGPEKDRRPHRHLSQNAQKQSQVSHPLHHYVYVFLRIYCPPQITIYLWMHIHLHWAIRAPISSHQIPYHIPDSTHLHICPSLDRLRFSPPCVVVSEVNHARSSASWPWAPYPSCNARNVCACSTWSAFGDRAAAVLRWRTTCAKYVLRFALVYFSIKMEIH